MLISDHFICLITLTVTTRFLKLLFHWIILGHSDDGIVLIQTLAKFLPLTTLVNLNNDLSLIELLSSVLNPTDSCKTTFLDFLCFALARDIPLYLSLHPTSYSYRALSSIVEWNSQHLEYIPYGQTLFIRAIQSPITEEKYNEYKQILQESFQKFVNQIKSKYSLDCLLTIGNEDMLSSTTLCGVPRANLTLNYYNPDYKQINVIAVGLSSNDDLILLRFLHRLEQANLQAGKIDIRTSFQKFIQHPIKSVYRKNCTIL